MDATRIFQVEKSKEDIRKTNLTNVVKMLTERKLLNFENLDDNIKNVINMKSDDYTYVVKIDNYKAEPVESDSTTSKDKAESKSEDKTIIVKIFHQKITAVSKQSPISDFLNKYRDNHKIIIVLDMGTKARQQIANNYPKTEVFLEKELMINIMEYGLVPFHEIIDKNSDESKTFYETYKTKKKNMPRIDMNDPVARYYNMKRGDLCRIVRPSETSGFVTSYRIVV